MLATIKAVLVEHNLSDQGGGNNYIASTDVPETGNFEGKVWHNTRLGGHYFYYDGRYIAVNEESVYGGMVRETKSENGTFVKVETLAEDGTILHRSTLSNPDSDGNFAVRTIVTNVGTSSERTEVYDVTYDEDGDFTSEVKR